MQEYQIEFAGNRIDQVPGVELYNYDFTQLPYRDIKIHKLARRSLSIITSSEYTQKSIPVWLDVCSGDRQDTETTITELKALLQPQNGLLKVLQSGRVYEYTATMNEFNIEWNGSNAYCQIVFLASTPIGSTSQSEPLAAITNITTPFSSTTFNVDGSYNARPLITVSIQAITGSGSFTILNARTQQGITISEAFSAGDTIEIDSYNLSARWNGAEVDFDGLFPAFGLGSQQLSYTDTFATRQVDITVTYKPQII